MLLSLRPWRELAEIVNPEPLLDASHGIDHLLEPVLAEQLMFPTDRG